MSLTPLELSADTARLAVTPAPAGKPGGPGLYHVAGMQLPPYFQHVRDALIRSGHPLAEAYEITWGAIRRWARGGGKAHPEVVAAAQAALADLKAKAAIAHSHANETGGAVTLTWNGQGIDLASIDLGGYLPPHVPAGSPTGGQFGTTSGGKAQPGTNSGGTAGKTPAQQHKLHMAHVAHLQHLVATGKASPAQKAELAGLLKALKGVKAKAPVKLKVPAKAKAVAKPKAPAKPKAAAVKAAVPAKAKVPVKAKAAAAPKAAKPKAPVKPSKPVVDKKKGTVTTVIGGKKVTVTLAQWHAAHVAHLEHVAHLAAVKKQKAAGLAGDGGRFLDLAFTEALADRVPPGKPEGGQFTEAVAQLTRHDTPAMAARAINAMEAAQRAMVRASTLPPPGFEWQANDRLAEVPRPTS